MDLNVGATGGDALMEALGRIVKRVSTAKVTRVGFLEGATYPDGTPVALVAAANEFGRPDKNQPARPFMRNAISDHKHEWSDKLAAALKGDASAEDALAMVGEVMAGDVKRSIQELDAPPLAPSTIAQKGFAKPLIDTGHMLSSVASDVKDLE